MYFFEKVSNNLAAKIASVLKFDKDREEVIAYGAFNLLQTLWSTFVLVIFGIIFGTFPSILVIALTAALLRKFSGGAHATSPNRCTLTSVIAFGSFSILIKYIMLYINVTLIILYQIASFIFTYVTLFKHCPVDSPNKPIKNPETRLKFRKASFKVLFLIYFISLLLWIFFLKTHEMFLLTVLVSISTGILWQSLTMTYTGHLIINKFDIFIQNINLTKE